MWRYLRIRTLLRNKYHRPWSDAAQNFWKRIYYSQRRYTDLATQVKAMHPKTWRNGHYFLVGHGCVPGPRCVQSTNNRRTVSYLYSKQTIWLFSVYIDSLNIKTFFLTVLIPKSVFLRCFSCFFFFPISFHFRSAYFLFNVARAIILRCFIRSSSETARSVAPAV